MPWQISQGQLGAEVLGDAAADHGAEILTGFFVDEGVARFVPAKLEAGGKRGDADFANGRVGRNYELGLRGSLEDNLEFSGFAFDVETMLIACGEHAALEFFERGVGFSLKVFIVEHAFSVHEESKSWVVSSGGGEEARTQGGNEI